MRKRITAAVLAGGMVMTMTLQAYAQTPEQVEMTEIIKILEEKGTSVEVSEECPSFSMTERIAMQKAGEKLIATQAKEGDDLEGTSLFAVKAQEAKGGLIARIDETLSCNGEGLGIETMSYVSYGELGYGMFSSYEDFTDTMKAYGELIKGIKAKEAVLTEAKSYPQPEQAMKLLQTKVMQMGYPDEVWENPLSFDESLLFELAVVPNGNDEGNIPTIKAQLNMDIAGEYALEDEAFAMNFAVEGDLLGKEPGYSSKDDGESFAVAGLLDLEMVMIDDALYIRPNTVDFSFEHENMDYESNDIDQAVEKKDQFLAMLGEKYIKVPLSPENNEHMSIAMMMAQNANLNSFDMMIALRNNSLVQFVHKEGNTYYGVPSTQMCRMIGNMGTMNPMAGMMMHNPYQEAQAECAGWIADMLDMTDGKGFIRLKDHGNGTYALGLTSKFVTDELTLNSMKEDTPFLFEKDLLVWNKSAVQKLTIPFDEGKTNGIFYSRPELRIVYKEKTDMNNVDIDIRGTVEQKKVNLIGKFNIEDEFVGEGTLLVQRDQTHNTQDLTLHLDMDLAGAAVVVDLEAGTDFDVLADSSIVAPEEFVDLYNLEALMNGEEVVELEGIERYSDYQKRKFATCLKKNRIVLYGSDTCPYCQTQKELFGEAFEQISYVDCREAPYMCAKKGISAYPTWVFDDGYTLVGTQSLENLAAETSCSL